MTSGINENTRDTVDFLIRKYNLHDQLPVRLDKVMEHFTLRYHNFTPVTLGFAVVRPRVVYIGINQNLDQSYRRVAEAHETGHIVAYHPHKLYTCKVEEWYKDEIEREAQVIASYLLIPPGALQTYYEEFTTNELAELLQVPARLIDLRWVQGKLTGEI